MFKEEIFLRKRKDFWRRRKFFTFPGERGKFFEEDCKIFRESFFW